MQEHELWILYASNNLETAKTLLREDRIYSSSFFLAQQCGEKALKAFLISKQRHLRKIDNLIELLNDCMEIDPSFIALKKDAEGLNPFSITFRYPDTSLAFPDKTTLTITIAEAERILDFVKERLQ